MRGLNVGRIELDEAWSHVGKKQRRVAPEDGANVGDQYVFIALDSIRKAILSYRIGKRDGVTTGAFCADLRERVVNRPEISSDAFAAYPWAIDLAFGVDVDYGQIVKTYHGEPAIDAARRYSPGYVVAVQKTPIVGCPRKISTSLVERQNLTLRMQSRRFTRFTNAFPKKIENHAAAVSLYVNHYNLCRVHEALRVTPAMALGVADHIWTIGELIEAASSDRPLAPTPRQIGQFRVIEGGKA